MTNTRPRYHQSNVLSMSFWLLVILCWFTVELRAWRSTKGESLIPFADFLNHDGLSEAVVLHDEDKQLSEVIADRDYAPKEEVWITYGKFPNSTLLLDFGFSLPYNSYDEGAALSFKYYQHCFSSMKESVVLPSYELSEPSVISSFWTRSKKIPMRTWISEAILLFFFYFESLAFSFSRLVSDIGGIG